MYYDTELVALEFIWLTDRWQREDIRYLIKRMSYDCHWTQGIITSLRSITNAFI